MTMEVSRDQVPDPHALLRDTAWDSISHAYGPADDTPLELVKLLSEDSDRIDEAVQHVSELVSHQNSVYQATAPVALYIAGILSDPRLAAATTRYDDGQARPLRASLLDWLGCTADDITDEIVAINERHGFPLDGYVAMKEMRSWRPAIFQAVSAFLHDPDPDIRRAAVIAGVLLLDSPAAVDEHGMVPAVSEVLETSTDQFARRVARDVLNALVG
ncbi:hypothetical protein [Catellatospora sp. NPDC049609]|uniref:hypothetical protein n=1 Tax=Catellatospora sp. NPDC049609 TaxID=3155505 RepID=UPI00343BD1D3